VETWTLQQADRKHLKGCEMWCWIRKEISWTDCVRNKYYIQPMRKSHTQ